MELLLDNVTKKKGGAKRAKKQPEYTPQELADVIHDHCDRHGGGFFGDLWDGLKKGFNTVAGIAKPVLSMIPHPAAQAVSKGLETFGYGKPKRGRKKAGALTGCGEAEDDGGALCGAAKPKRARKKVGGDAVDDRDGGAMTGAALTGAAKPKRQGNTKRIEIVKACMKKHKMNMIQASKYVKEKGLYKK
jgi:hypothetical protein